MKIIISKTELAHFNAEKDALVSKLLALELGNEADLEKVESQLRDTKTTKHTFDLEGNLIIEVNEEFLKEGVSLYVRTLDRIAPVVIAVKGLIKSLKYIFKDIEKEVITFNNKWK